MNWDWNLFSCHLNVKLLDSLNLKVNWSRFIWVVQALMFTHPWPYFSHRAHIIYLNAKSGDLYILPNWEYSDVLMHATNAAMHCFILLHLIQLQWGSCSRGEGVWWMGNDMESIKGNETRVGAAAVWVDDSKKWKEMGRDCYSALCRGYFQLN